MLFQLLALLVHLDEAEHRHQRRREGNQRHQREQGMAEQQGDDVDRDSEEEPSVEPGAEPEGVRRDGRAFGSALALAREVLDLGIAADRVLLCAAGARRQIADLIRRPGRALELRLRALQGRLGLGKRLGRAPDLRQACGDAEQAVLRVLVLPGEAQLLLEAGEVGRVSPAGACPAGRQLRSAKHEEPVCVCPR